MSEPTDQRNSEDHWRSSLSQELGQLSTSQNEDYHETTAPDPHEETTISAPIPLTVDISEHQATPHQHEILVPPVPLREPREDPDAPLARFISSYEQGETAEFEANMCSSTFDAVPSSSSVQHSTGILGDSYSHPFSDDNSAPRQDPMSGFGGQPHILQQHDLDFQNNLPQGQSQSFAMHPSATTVQDQMLLAQYIQQQQALQRLSMMQHAQLQHQHNQYNSFQPTPANIFPGNAATIPGSTPGEQSQVARNNELETGDKKAGSRKRKHKGTDSKASGSGEETPEAIGTLAQRVKDKLGMNKPKRPLSAYNIFFKDERVRILKEGREQSEEFESNEDSSKMSSKASNKEPMGTDLDPATAAVTDYSTAGISSQSSFAAGRGETTSEVVKRDRRNNPHKKMGFEEMGKAISKRWKEISPNHLADCKRRADEDKKRYNAEMKTYREKHSVALKAAQEELDCAASQLGSRQE